jgi:hypothetical protein
MVAAVINIEELRQFRTMNLNSNWTKDLRTEIYKHMYDKPIHPKNLWLENEPQTHANVDEIYRNNIKSLEERGAYTPPAHIFPGAYCQSPPMLEDEWRDFSKLWDKWNK